ncbi:MAG: putative addiction module antidote protein [Endomicrobium sp.]|jgi:probable addiction module antidote protein|nr:putative addiction module antidote protein [Endomicrobium sp.]
MEKITITKDDAKLSPFDTDISKHLTDDEMIKFYLNQVLEDGDEAEFKRALGYIAKAKGMTTIAKETGISRDGLYKTLLDGATKDTYFSTIKKLLDNFGFRLKVEEKRQILSF